MYVAALLKNIEYFVIIKILEIVWAIVLCICRVGLANSIISLEPRSISIVQCLVYSRCLRLVQDSLLSLELDQASLFFVKKEARESGKDA